jgi:hypothetical protein
MPSLQDKLERRANARTTRSGPVRQDMFSGSFSEEKTLFRKTRE